MDAVLRATAVYLFLLLLFRVIGRRTVGELTTFDFILLLIISEATQQAMLTDDFSVTNGFIVILTLVAWDVVLSLLKRRSPRVDRFVDGVPLIVVDNGQPRYDVMYRARIDESDILAAARMNQGLERIDQIKYAVLEPSGGISIIPMPATRNGG